MEAVFLKLVNMSLTASWLVLAVMILRILLKNAPKYIRVILWGFVGVRLVFPFSLESMFSVVPSSEPLPEEFLYAATPQINTGIPVINNAINPVITQTMAPAAGASANPTQVWSFIFSQIWILGLVLMVLYAAVSYFLVYRRVAASIRIGENLRLCDHIESPFILGIFKPQIYLPSELDPKTADLVLAHEYAHLKRKDHWWKPLGFALLCVYWFNPVMWLAYILLCRDIELACDEKVVQELGADDKKAYSSALLRCSVNRKMIAACPLAFGEVGVKDRIKSVLHYKKPAFWVIVAAVVICVVVAVCFLTDPLNTVDPMTLDDWGISITAEDPSPTGVTLVYDLPKITDGEFTIPLNQTLLQLKDGKWIEVLTVIEEDGMPGWIKWLYADEEASYQRLEWDTAYGTLEPGAYRIRKTIWLHRDELLFQKDFYADFIIPINSNTWNDADMPEDEWSAQCWKVLKQIQAMDSYHINAAWKFEGGMALNESSNIDYWKSGDTRMRIGHIPDTNETIGILFANGQLLASQGYSNTLNWVPEETLDLLTPNDDLEEVLNPWLCSFRWNDDTTKAISRQDHSGGYTIRLKINEPVDNHNISADSYHVDFTFDDQDRFQYATYHLESEKYSRTGVFTVMETSEKEIKATIDTQLKNGNPGEQDGFTMTIVDSQHYDNGLSVRVQVDFPEAHKITDFGLPYPEEVVLIYESTTGVSHARVSQVQVHNAKSEDNSTEYWLIFDLYEAAPTGSDFRLSFSGFSGNSGQKSVTLSSPLSVSWSGTVEEAHRYEYIQGDTRIDLTISSFIVNITAYKSSFDTVDKLCNNLRIFDAAGQIIPTNQNFSGSEGSALVYSSILVENIDIDSISGIYIGNCELTRVGVQSAKTRLAVGSYIPAECVYMTPLSSYYANNISNEVLYRVTDDSFLTEKYGTLTAVNLQNIDWGWKTMEEAGGDLDFYRNWLPLGYVSQGGLGLSDKSLYQKLNENYHLILQPDGDLLLIQGQHSTNQFESVWSIFRLVSIKDLGEIVNPYPESVRDVWMNGRDQLAPYIYISPVSAVEFSRLSILDHMIRSAIFAYNVPDEQADRVWLESHVILNQEVTCGTTESGVFLGRTTVYVLSQLCEVEEKDGQIEVISRGLIPAVLTFDETYEHSFSLREYRQARSWKTDELKNHFPESVTENMLPVEQYETQFDNDIFCQAIYYFDVLPRASATELLTLIAMYRQDFMFSLNGEGIYDEWYSPWIAQNSRQYSNTLAEYKLEPIPDYSPGSQDSPRIIMRFTVGDETVELSFFEGSDVLTLYQRNKLTAYRAVWPWGDQPIGTLVRSWFDEAEFAAMLVHAVFPVLDKEQGCEAAVQEYCHNYYATHIRVSNGSAFRYNFVKTDVMIDMEATERARLWGEIDENGYAFWVTVYFLPENDRAHWNAMSGNTHEYTGSDPDIPEGTYVFTRCGYIRLQDDAWVGEIIGTGF